MTKTEAIKRLGESIRFANDFGAAISEYYYRNEKNPDTVGGKVCAALGDPAAWEPRTINAIKRAARPPFLLR